jgi:hypothetical protein
MKRITLAVAIGLLAVPALAQTGMPYEQTEIDRLVPTFRNGPAPEIRSADDLPPAQSQLHPRDLGMPDRVQLAQVGTSSYKSSASGGATAVTGANAESSEDSGNARRSVWDTDHNFIAPPQ